MSTGSVSEPRTRSQRRRRLGGDTDADRLGTLRGRPDLLAGAALGAIVITSFTVTAIWVRGIHTFSVMPDELGYVKQALTIAHSLRPVLPSDVYFSSWGQLFPALLAPIFGTMDIVSAYYAAHTIEAFLLASAAIPVFMIAMEMRLGRLAACLVAALTAAVPWMVLSALVMTEDLAYPVFLWAVLAMFRAMTAPSSRRDAVAIAGVLVAFLTRTQFLVLGPILIVAIVAHEVALARGQGPGRAIGTGLCNAVTHHRLLAVGTAVACVGLVLLAAAGSASDILGHYSIATQGSLLPQGTLSSGLGQLYDVAIAGGIIPLTLSTAWMAATVGRPRAPERHAYAVLLVVAVVALIVLLGAFVVRYLVVTTVTDRYMFYVVPLLFVGMAAWVIDDRDSSLVLIIVTAAVTALVLLETLYPTVVPSILNPSFTIQHLLSYKAEQFGTTLGISDLDPRVPIAVATAAFVLGMTILRARVSRTAALLAVTLPVLLFVGGQTIYTMTKITPLFAGVSAGSPQADTWIDRAVPSGAKVGLLVAFNQDELNSERTWWTLSFWNKAVQRAYVLPGGDAFAQGYVVEVSPDPATGAIDGLQGTKYLVKLSTDPRLGVRGTPLVQLGILDLYRLTSATPLTYSTVSVGDGGAIDIHAAPLIRFYGTGAAPVRRRVTVTLLVAPPDPDCPCTLYTGTRKGAVPLPAPAPGGTDVAFSRTIELRRHGGVTLPLVVRGRRGTVPSLSINLVSVRISPP